MKKTLLPLLVSLLVLLCACGTNPSVQEEETSFSIAATTYPVYLFTSQVAQGVEGVTVIPVINQPMSCLHNYTLSVNDMKVLENANVIALNGVGLEDFMSDALEASDAFVIDCSSDIPLHPLTSHYFYQEAKDPHETEQTEMDPHIWMDPNRASLMIENIASGLSEADPAHTSQYLQNAEDAVTALQKTTEELKTALEDLSCRELVTFHNGFCYFAETFELNVLKSIEEEAGSEASGKDMGDIVTLIKTHELPAIFTEKFGSEETANALSRETGAAVYSLTMMMHGPIDSPGIAVYEAELSANVQTILEALG